MAIAFVTGFSLFFFKVNRLILLMQAVQGKVVCKPDRIFDRIKVLFTDVLGQSIMFVADILAFLTLFGLGYSLYRRLFIKPKYLTDGLDARLTTLVTAVIISPFHLINAFLMVPAIAAHVLKKASVNFAILDEEERCHGDVARRAGNEYLAQMMISENVEILNQYRPKKILVKNKHRF